MKKSKIIITFTLIITSLFLSGCGIFTGSKSNGLIFRDIDSNTCEVIGYEEPISKKSFEFITQLFTKEQGVDIVIPSKYEDKKVVRIGEFAFVGNDKLKNIVIPDSVISIGKFAFAECHRLKSIVIPNSVTSIGNSAFESCSNLTSITLPFIGNTLDGTTNTHFGYVFGASSYEYNNPYVPNTLKEVIIKGSRSIGSFAFRGCSSLESVIIEDSVTSIGSSAFRGCSSLESIVIPNSVTSIGYGAFEGCSSLISIEIPESVTNIDGLCFSSNLKSVYYSGTINDWCNIRFNGLGSNLMSFAEHFYMKDSNNEYYEVTEIEIPNTVTSIGHEQFSGFDNITTIVIPDSVAKIGASAFYGCSSLESVYYNGTLEDWCNIKFNNEYSNPMSYAEHFYMKDSNNEYYEVTEIEIPNTITSIGNYQFSSLENVVKIVIPESVTSIGSSVFSGCDRLIIYCEIESQPSGWNSNWNSGARPVIWGYRN